MMQSSKKAEDYNEALLPCVLPDSFALAESSGVVPDLYEYAEHRW